MTNKNFKISSYRPLHDGDKINVHIIVKDRSDAWWVKSLVDWLFLAQSSLSRKLEDNEGMPSKLQIELTLNWVTLLRKKHLSLSPTSRQIVRQCNDGIIYTHAESPLSSRTCSSQSNSRITNTVIIYSVPLMLDLKGALFLWLDY